MKLHLPTGLRSALFSCFAALASLSPTLATATIAGGVFAVTVSSVAHAEDYTGGYFTGSQLGCKLGEDGTFIKLNDTSLTSDDTVTFNGQSGWLNLDPQTYNINFKLEGDGLIISDGSSGRQHDFNGAFSGSGQFKVNANNGSGNALRNRIFNFKGEMKDYTGAMSVGGSSQTVNFDNSGDSVRTLAASSLSVEGTTNFKGNYAVTNAVTLNALAIKSGTTTFNGTGSTASSLTVDNGATASVGVGGALTVSGSTTVNGTLTNAGNLTLSGAVTLKSTINNTGALDLSNLTSLDVSAMEFTEEGGKYSLTLVTGDGTVTGAAALSADSITMGESTAGKSFSYENGVLSYVVTSSSLSWGDGALTWVAGVDMTGGQFAQEDIVAFTGAADVTLGENIAAAQLTFSEGAAVSLIGNGNKLDCGGMVMDGSLTIKDDVLTADSRMSGAGSLVFDWGVTDATTTYSAILSGFTGDVTVASGRYNHTAAASFASLTVKDGAMLALSANLGCAVNVEGEVNVLSSGTRSFDGKISGSGDIVVAPGNGSLFFKADVAHSGKLVVSAGTAYLGANQSASNSISSSVVEVMDGATFGVAHVTADFSGTDMVINGGGKLHCDDMDNGSGVSFGTLSIAEASAKNSLISYNWNGKFNFAELTGEGNLDINAGGQAAGETHVTTFSSIKDFSGAISKSNSGHHSLVIGSVDLSAGMTTTITTAVSSDTFAKLGEGTLQLTSLAASGVLNMNYEGVLQGTDGNALTAITVADGTTLTYADRANTISLAYSALSSLTSISVDMLALQDSMPDEGVNLGITGLDDTTLEELKGKLAVAGLSADDWTLSLSDDGSALFKMAADAEFSSDWDLNWGGTLAGAPATLKSAAPTATTAIGASGSEYLADGKAAILLTGGGGDAVEIYGGASETTTTLDSWIAVEGGTWALVAGGNYANNWGSGAAANFNGDSHIKMTGGTVKYLIGGNYKDGKAPIFTGDTYISVFGGTVSGSIIGSGVSVHSAGLTMNGSTHIFVYTPLSDNSAGALVSATPHSVIGGNLHGSNTLDGKTINLTGSTNVTIDLSKHSGEASFTKGIVGGDYMAINYGAVTFSIQQDTNVTLTAPEEVTFASNIIGGTNVSEAANNSRILIGGSTNITINGGTYGNGVAPYAVIGGMLANASRSGYTISVGGGSNITLNSGTLAANANIIGGSYLGGSVSGAKVTQGGSNVLLNGGTVNGSVLGGHYLVAGDATVGTVQMGEVTVTVDGATVAGLIGGGSSNNRSSAEGSITQGDITVQLLSGSVGSVYAAGLQNGSAAMTTASTTVEIAADITIAEGSVISGGYLMGESGSNATVTGASTLRLTGTAGYSNLAQVDIHNFSVIDAASDVTIKSLTASADSLTKLGDGALSFTGGGNLKSIRTIDVQGGRLDTGTSWVDGGLTSISVAAGSSLKSGGLGFAASAALSLDLTGATSADAAIVSAGTLSGLDTKLAMTLAGTADLEVGVYKLMDWTSGSLDLSKVEWADATAGFELAVQGSALVLSVGDPNAWNWDGTDGAVWKDDSGASWEGQGAASSPADKVLYFNTLDGKDAATVTIEGDVTPGEVRVMGSTAYTFDGEGKITGDAAVIVASGAELTIANSGNDYTGKTEVQGTLTIANTNALTTSTIEFNGGEVVFAAAETLDVSRFAVSNNAAARFSVEGGVTATLQGTGADTDWQANGIEVSGEGVLKFASVGRLALSGALSGDGTVSFVAVDDVLDRVAVTGDNSAFTGTVLLEGSSTAASVSFSADNAMGSGTVELAGLGFAVGEYTNAASILVTADTTQHVFNSGDVSTFTGAVTGDKCWMLGYGGVTNVLSGDLSAFTGTLAAQTYDGEAYNTTWKITSGGEVKATLQGVVGTGPGCNIFQFAAADAVTLSGAVTGDAVLQQSGAGVLTLTGESSSTGELYIENGCEVRLGSADKAAAWAGTSLKGSGSLVLVNGTLTNGLKAEAETQLLGASGGAGSIIVDVAENGTVDMGGTQGSMIDGSISIAAGGTLKGIAGDLTVGAGATPSLTLAMSTANLGSTGADMILFEDTASTLTLDASLCSLDLSNEALKAALINETGSTLLHITNGTLVLDETQGEITINPLLDALGMHLEGVQDGALVLSGKAEGVYKVLSDGSGDLNTVDGHGTLGMYQATFVDSGETLTMNLPGDAGTGAVVNNLIGLESADAAAPTKLVVNNTAPDSGKALVVLTNSVQSFDTTPDPAEAVGADTTFEGAIIAGADVIVAKAGAGTLTVTDSMQVADTLRLEEGSIVLNNEGTTASSIGTLNLAGADDLASAGMEILAGTTSVTTLMDEASGGTLSLGEDATLVLVSGGSSLLESSAIDGAGTVVIEQDAQLALDGNAGLNGVETELIGTLDVGNSTVSVISSLTAVESAQIKGDGGSLEVTGVSSFDGTMQGTGMLELASAADMAFGKSFTPAAGWSVTNKGVATFDLVKEDGSSTLTLDTLTLGSDSQTSITCNTDTGVALLELSTLVTEQGAILMLDSGDAQTAITGTTYTLGSAANWTGTADDVSLVLSGYAFSLIDAEKTTLSVENGSIVLNLAMTTRNAYAEVADNDNSAAGATILWGALTSGAAPAGTDLQKVTEALSQYVEGGSTEEANSLMAASAGASIATLSSAFSGDMERQLRAIRNRTTTMGVDPGVVNEDMPYFNAWINAEGDYRKVEADGMMPGYTLSSWGGTVGFDVDFNENTTAGLAITAMYGDLDADSEDKATGEMDTYYVSAFARVTSRRWTHTFVGSIGKMDATLERTVNYGTGSYTTKGETQGMGFGLMYEVGYTMPMNEDASFCLQPVANVTWRHIDVDGYTESGSDAALSAGSQTYDAITFGLGARAQAAVGENIYNRTSILEARALLKIDAGDRKGEADVAFAHGGATGKVSSAELGPVGLEFGAGVTIPVGQEGGALFIDGSAEIRSSATDINGTVGYRINF